MSAGCAAAPTASAARPAEASSVAPTSRTPGMASSIIATVISTITKAAVRESIATRVRRLRAATGSEDSSLRVSSAAAKARTSDSATQPTSAGTSSGATHSHTALTFGLVCATMEIATATTDQRIGR